MKVRSALPRRWRVSTGRLRLQETRLADISKLAGAWSGARSRGKAGPKRVHARPGDPGGHEEYTSLREIGRPLRGTGQGLAAQCEERSYYFFFFAAFAGFLAAAFAGFFAAFLAVAILSLLEWSLVFAR